VGEAALRQGRRRGVGLANVERRLEGYYGGVASLGISSAPGAGTRVEIRLPAGAPLAAAEAGGARRPA
jgi:sensor histidine kinase YesM